MEFILNSEKKNYVVSRLFAAATFCYCRFYLVVCIENNIHIYNYSLFTYLPIVTTARETAYCFGGSIYVCLCM